VPIDKTMAAIEQEIRKRYAKVENVVISDA
jgi:hypothetical protein